MMDTEKTTLASEILAELRASAKRWFIIAMAELLVILALIVGMLWYFSLPIDTSVTVENDDGNANYIGRDLKMTGGIYNGENYSKDTESSAE